MTSQPPVWGFASSVVDEQIVRTVSLVVGEALRMRDLVSDSSGVVFPQPGYWATGGFQGKTLCLWQPQKLSVTLYLPNGATLHLLWFFSLELRSLCCVVRAVPVN